MKITPDTLKFVGHDDSLRFNTDGCRNCQLIKQAVRRATGDRLSFESDIYGTREGILAVQIERRHDPSLVFQDVIVSGQFTVNGEQKGGYFGFFDCSELRRRGRQICKSCQGREPILDKTALTIVPEFPGTTDRVLSRAYTVSGNI